MAQQRTKPTPEEIGVLERKNSILNALRAHLTTIAGCELTDAELMTLSSIIMKYSKLPKPP